MTRRWPPNEYELAKQWHAEGMPLAEIAKALDRSIDSIKSKLHPRYVKKGVWERFDWNEKPIRESLAAAQTRMRLYGESRYEDR